MEIKKFLSVFVIAAFVLFDSACLMPRGSMGMKKTVKKDVVEVDSKDTGLRIVNVITKEGRDIQFGTKRPARFLADGSAVEGLAAQQFAIERKDIKIIRRAANGRILQIETLDGRVTKVKSAKEEADRVLYLADAPIRVPTGDIQQVWIRKTDAAATAVIVVVSVGAFIGLGLLVAGALKNSGPWPEWDSCPFVYSYNGGEYILDAEPYGMAITEGLTRTDWVEMSNLREVDGKYRVLLANELDETQFTDELKLVAVDHAPGLKVAPDFGGRFHTFARPLPPAKAVDREGRDILPFVAENDRVFWVSRLDEKSPDDPVMRDELIIEFPKPAGAKRAKLLANVWTTQWASQSARLFLELYGSSLPQAYADVDRHGPTYGQVLKWMSSEEIATMKVWVETPGGWKARGMIYGGAPVITKDKAYTLDVADVPGETLRIKLRPPVNCWMVNSLAVDYGEDEPIETVEIAAVRAVDPSGRDVRGTLAATDRSYLEAANRGERTELVFPAPSLKAGRERTVFVKASGYYKIHLEAKGEPQTDLIARVLAEPDFAARYAFREYLHWEAGLKAQAERAGVKQGSATGPAKVKRTQDR